jgi:prepilin-type processing-associated H-X9-DG protein
MNQFLQPDANVRSFRIYEIDHPANVVFMTEVNAYEPAVTPERVDFRFGPGGASQRAVANVLFCDGHVEPVTRARLENPEARLAATAESGISWFEK